MFKVVEIKVVEKVLKAFLKTMTYYQMMNNHESDTCWEDGDHGTTFLLKLQICSYLIYGAGKNTTQKSIPIVFCVNSIRHDLLLSKYRKQKQSLPWKY